MNEGELGQEKKKSFTHLFTRTQPVKFQHSSMPEGMEIKV